MNKTITALKVYLESLYEKYNKKEYVSPDPLQFLYDYSCVRDREIVGLIASSLAYGRVSLILKNVEYVLDLIHPPYLFLRENHLDTLQKRLEKFKHRFNNGLDILRLLNGIKRVLEKYGSLEGCLSHYYSKEADLRLALYFFINELIITDNNFLLPNPLGGGACKRLMLYLRWMVRKDEVDCGGWTFISPKDLIIPLDTHMFRISKILGLTKRNTPNFKAALEITERFKLISPNDPVKYDFVLTRFGIRNDMDINELYNMHDISSTENTGFITN